MKRRAVDTNVLARALLDDGSAQSAQALAALRATDILIPDTVMLETEWLLRSHMGLKAKQVNVLLARLLSLPNISFNDRAKMGRAVRAHASGMDFADVLHLLHSEGCEAIISFDRKFARRAAKLNSAIPVVAP